MAGQNQPGRQAWGSTYALNRSDRDWISPNRPVGFEEPGRSVKERKAKIPKWLALMAHAAWESTEIVDLIDEIFKALPPEVQATAPRTAITSPTAWKPGIRYTGPLDKLRHIYNNLDRLDIEQAVLNVIMNQIEDAIWGRFFGKADQGWKRAGVNGYGVLF